MATVKVKIRPTAIPGMAGTVYYQIVHRRQVRQIATDIHLSVGEWDEGRERLVAEPGGESVRQYKVWGEVVLLKQIVRELEQLGEAYTADDVVARFSAKAEAARVLRFMREQIGRLEKADRFGTAKNYEKVLNSFSGFLEGEDLPFFALTERLVGDYNAYLLRRGMVRNSVSFYMRVLRAVYNKAVRRRLVEQAYPFREVYTGIDTTRKRAVSESVIMQLCGLSLPERSALALARDIFIFSYCARGMAFVDIAYLRKENIQNGAICYSRHKTGQALTVKIEPGMRRIMERYASDSGVYVFPLLDGSDALGAYRQYRSALNAYNRSLKKLSRMLPGKSDLTSYVARHSWATAARNHHVPLSVISAGMGHASERTTQIYLATIDNSVIDAANQEIIKCLNDRVP